jgi:type IV secretory pathway VirB3-like protein
MAPRGRPGVGCVGSLVGLVVFVAVVVATVFAGLIVLGIVAALVVIGLIAFAIDRLLLAISPKRRERRAAMQRSFVIWGAGVPPPAGGIIDTTARLEDPEQRPGSEGSTGADSGWG